MLHVWRVVVVAMISRSFAHTPPFTHLPNPLPFWTGRTALTEACRLSHTDMAAKLIAAGANVNLHDEEGSPSRCCRCGVQRLWCADAWLWCADAWL